MAKRNKTNCKVRKHRSYSDKIASGDYDHMRHTDFTEWEQKYAKKQQQQEELTVTAKWIEEE